MGLKVTRIATAGQELAGGSTLDATYAGTDVDVTTGLPLDGLLDVNAPAPADNDVLTWDDAAGEWIAAPGGAGTGLDVELVTVLSSGAAETIDVSVARTYDVTLTSTPCVLTLTGSVDAEAWFLTLLLRQDSTGNRTVTWPAEVTWIDGTAPVLATAAADVDIITLLTVDGGAQWIGAPGQGGGGTTVAALDDLTDVNAASPTDGDVLAWDDGASEWVPAPAATAANISALGFVGQILISDTPSTPLVFADLIQNEAQTDLVYADL